MASPLPPAVGKDDFLDALSSREGAGVLAGDLDEQTSPIPETRAEQEETDEEDLAFGDAAEAAAFQHFLEASDEEEVNDELLHGLDVSPEPVQASRRPGGVLSTHRSHAKVRKALTNDNKLKNIEQLQHDFAAKSAAAQDAKDTLDIEEQKLRALRKQATNQGADATRLGYQEKEVSKAWGRLTEAEQARDLAELALHHLADTAARAGRQAQRDVAEHGDAAQQFNADEQARAKKTLDNERYAREDEAYRQEMWKQELQRRQDNANEHQKIGRKRLKETQKALVEKQQQAEEVRESRFQKDAHKVLQLKESIGNINRQINGQNEARRKKQQKVQEEREARKRDMLNEGKNPYEEWRREEIIADKEKQVQTLKLKQELRSEKLMEQLIHEDISYKKKQKVIKEQRLQKEEFQRQMGNYAKELRVAAYIRKVTIGNVDVLDPTGTALRIDGSKVTVQKTHAFGLGKVRPDEIDKVDRDIKKAKKLMGSWKPPRPVDPNDDIGDDLLPNDDGAGTTQSLDDTATQTDGRLWVPNLSVLEKKYLAAARERQKANICSVQRCWGKEFKGDAFIAKPSIIAFFDFEVGKKYRQVVEVTNISLTFNQFKLLPLDDRYKDFFDIEFVPPGRMSAGVTRYLTVWFTPKVYEDIDTVFPILAKTGPIDFPLQCKTKKTILTITPQDADANAIIDFGHILAGEQGQQVLQIKNSGALSAGYKLEALDSESDFLKMVSWTPETGDFGAHATSKIAFTFKPTALGSFTAMLTMTINNGAQGMARLAQEWRVLLRGVCIDVPIYVEQEEYNFKTCVFDHTFRDNIVLHNRQSVAMKIIVDEPKPIPGELTLTPTVAYIQGAKSQAIGVKFSPGENFLSMYPQYRDRTRPEVQGAFRIPVKIVGVDQKLPVCCALVGILTTNLLTFTPSSLNFGSCFVGSALSGTLTIMNESALPQRYAFVRLPPFLTVDDFPTDVTNEETESGGTWGCGTAVLDGGGSGTLGMVLPGEKKRVCITYSPESATEMDYKLTLKVITGTLCVRNFTIQCSGQGRLPPITFSATQIDMASIPCGATSKESIELTNKSKVTYTLNLLAPPSDVSGLYACPVCCTLGPKETKRLQIDFKPTEAYLNLLQPPPIEPVELPEGEEAPVDEEGNPIPPTPTGPSAEEHRLQKLKEIKENGGRRWESGHDDSDRSIHGSWKMPVCIRAKAEDHDQQSRVPVVTMYFGVRTCVLPSVLRVDPLVLDFGQVTALQREVVPIDIQNLFPGEPQELSIEPLPENACFTVLNAPRTIGAKPFKLMVEFKPDLVQIYQSTLKLSTQNTRVQVQLKGKGVRPVLKIKPENGILQLGSVIYNKACADYTTADLEIENDSPFELNYKLETIIPAEPHHIGPPPFTLTPSTGVVPGNGTKTVKVTFRPHRPLAVFREKIYVNVPNQKKPTYLYLYGHCFSMQTFAMLDLDYGPFGSSQAKGESAFLDSIAVGAGAATGADGQFAYQSAQQNEFSLVFEHGETAKCLLVGASVPPGTPSAPQNSPATTFDFQILQSEFSSFFTVEAPGAAAGAAAKGPVKPGDPAIKATFRYKPPESSSLAVGDMELDLLGGIGKWITCKVKGILAAGPETKEVSVELKAYLQQI